MMTDVSLPRKDAEAILRKTMMAVGYDKDMADVGVWSALWLEERFHSGVTSLVVYLMLVHGRTLDELRPRRHPDFRLAGVCPFMMADTVISLSDAWLPREKIAFGAPAVPFHMMASVADWASHRGKSVRFHHLNYSCLMSNDGITVETDDLNFVGWVNPDNNDPMMFELTNDRPDPARRKLDIVKISSRRLRGKDALDLS